MLLNTIVKAVKRDSHRGDQTVTTDQITTDIVACVNRSIREVQRMLPKRFWFKQSTVALTVGVAGTASTWSLASDVQEAIVFHFTSGNALYELTKIDSDREWIQRIWDPAAAVGIPRYYREIGPNSSTGYKQIEVFPIPNGSFTVNYEYYKTRAADLTTADLATALPDVPDAYQDVIEKGALYTFLKGFDDPGQAVAKLDYEESKRDLDIADDRDLDTDLAFRFDIKPKYPQNFTVG